MLNGKAKVEQRGPSKVVKIGSKARAAGATGYVDQYVELSRERTDKIFVVLAEFGDERHPDYPDKDTSTAFAGPLSFEGPRHNQIPEPDRSQDNRTKWDPSYDRQYYQNVYFGAGADAESLKTYYERQSSGRYSVDGVVTDWVKVPYNEARYGRSNGFPCAGDVCNNTWDLIRDAVNAWVTEQRAAGWTEDQIAADLAAFDVWDRFDYDGDGDFNERDGYIDHFQIVHAGSDQAESGPLQGEDAIWSHRWAAFPAKTSGPTFNRNGGAQIGNTGLWVRDYTIQAENAGLSVFAHDLGMPDLYDTASSLANPVSYWSIMAQSRISRNDDLGIDNRAADFGPWEKLQLGWLDYETVVAGQTKNLKLGPHEYHTTKPQAFVMVLPKKQVVTSLPVPPEGSRSWWGGKDNNLNNTLTRSVTVPAGAPILAFKAWWDIEDCGATACDYAYVEVDDGTGFTPIPGNITKSGEGNGIDGNSGGTWRDAEFDLSAYAGRTVQLRMRYRTDGATLGQGFFVDDLRVGGVFLDGAESGANGWTAAGFTDVGASFTTEFDNYYIGSHRSYVSFDRYLQGGVPNFGFAPDRPLWVEKFSYEEGLLLWYWDTSQRDNNTTQHPGSGLILPIDANPQLVDRADGQPWSAHIQAYDAPFSLEKSEPMTLHSKSVPSDIPAHDGIPLFDDSRSYYTENVAAGVRYGVRVPTHGVKIRVMARNGTSMDVRITG